MARPTGFGRIAMAGGIFIAFAVSTPLRAGSTKMISSWFAPEARGVKFQKLLVIVATRLPVTRRESEDEMVRLIRRRGNSAQVSYEFLAEDELENPASARVKVASSGADGAVVLRLYNYNRSTPHQPGGQGPSTIDRFTPDPTFKEYTFFSPHSSSDDLTYTKLVVEIETLIYSLRDDRLLWRGISRTKNPLQPHVVVGEIAEEILKKMQQQGLIQK